jgi:hypothetical protein
MRRLSPAPHGIALPSSSVLLNKTTIRFMLENEDGGKR